MRYYEFSVKVNENDIMKAAKADVGYVENALIGMNQYLYKHCMNNMYSFAYSKNNTMVNMALCFDEKQISLCQVEENLNCILGELDSNYVIVDSFVEITRFQFRDYINESKRRDYMVFRHNVLEFAKIDKLEYDDERHYYFNLQEMLISDKAPLVHNIYDESIKNELDNISSSDNEAVRSDINLAHYIISAKSKKAIFEMAQILANKLYEANRLSSKRIEIIDEVHIHLYKKNHFESLIEDSFGGVVILDMSTKFGDNASSYVQSCEYMANIIKMNKNKCLFIFANNISVPNFAYQLISRLENGIKILPIKEGIGSKSDAEEYLGSLVKNSDFIANASDVKAFMKTYNKDSFLQSEVIEYLDIFKNWYINDKSANDYNFLSTEELLNGHKEFVASPSKRLEALIGLKDVKKQINEIIAANVIDRERKKRQEDSFEARSMHMVFAGNPGTAKTTVAKLFGQVAKENNLIKSGIFVEKSGTDIVVNGASGIADVFEEAKGGILFIDEAYAITFPSIITAIIQEMENHRDEVITVFAGYSDSMKLFINRNDGLKSRIPYWIDFPDYTVDELVEILKLMMKDRGFTTSEDALSAAYEDFDKAVVMDNFGNGRYVRNYLEETIKKQSARLYSGKKPVEKISDKALFTLDVKDFNPEYNIPVGRHGKTAREELDAMIGLSSAKKVLSKAIASLKMRKMYNEHGIPQDKPTMHMVFTGNPGTAKTTTARLVAQILKDEKVLSSGTFVEAGRADLIGVIVGQTAQLVKQQFKKARGGVLFIDEAYSLCDSYKGFGDEAINTIVQEMENHREDVVVIFAGYTDEMQEFLERNPGMKSRIAFNVNFDDYSADELISITELMLKDKHMKITSDAKDKLHGIYNDVTGDKAFGNGRFVRQILEEAFMNLAERLISADPSKLSKKVLTTLTADDIPDRENKDAPKIKMGFSA